MARTQQGALARLYVAGDLSADELAWGAEIAATHERICRGIGVRTVSLETRIDSGGARDAAWREGLGLVRAQVAYSRWRAALPAPLPVLALIVEDLGIAAVARAYRMRNARAKALLHQALWLWHEASVDAANDVDQEDLLAIERRLS